MGIIICIIAVGIIGVGIYFSICTRSDHWEPKNKETLTSANPVSCETNRYNQRKFKTVVKFSDGFEYTSFSRNPSLRD